ncbi:hypothetical protein ACRYCC_24290 [Actinomadura scrupuli]|uniref:hypothetical protein n=1 Tax=Actinomadura scrupuli TaxID=559629 RepID=UPI003D984E93
MRAFALTVLTLLLLPVTMTAWAGSVSEHRAAADGRVVLVGVPALSWADLDRSATPNLWRMATQGSAGSLSVRAIGTIACPMDGWLTVSAGARAARSGGACGSVPPTPSPSGAGAIVPGYPELRRGNIESKFQSPVGLLGETVHRARRCTAAAGPGAALAMADAQGKVDVYTPAAGALTAQTLASCPITAVELDDLVLAPLNTATRAAAVRRVDAAVGRLAAVLPAGTSLLVAGVTDDAAPGLGAFGSPHLRVAMATGPGIRPGSYLTSDSTRRQGIVITPDVTATMLHLAGLPVPGEVLGTPWRAGSDRPADIVSELAHHDVAAQTIRRLLPRFFLGLVIAQVLFYGGAALVLRRRQNSGRREHRVLGATRLIALVSAAVPVSTYLVNLIPWWDTGHPTLVLLAGLAVADGLIVTAALAGPWRRTLLGPGAVVAAATALAIAVDLVTGTTLQLNSLMGYSPLVGGRYYGLGNIAFSVFATSVLLSSAGLAQWLLVRRPETNGARRQAAAGVLVVGLLAMALDGLPLWGSDFGGVIAIVPGLAVTAMMVAGKKISPVRLGLFCGAGGLVVLVIAYLDHRRPAGNQTHLGRFFGDLLHGHAGPVVERKFGAMVHTFGNMTLTPIAAAALVFLFLVLRRPDKLRAGALNLAYARAPMLRAGLMGALVTAVVGTLANDSGVAVLALALVVAVPFALVCGIRALETAPEPPHEPGGGQSAALTPDPATG